MNALQRTFSPERRRHHGRNNVPLIFSIVLVFLVIGPKLNYSLPLAEYEGRMRFNCPETSSCSCSFVISDYEVQCPPAEPQIVVRIQPNTYVQIDCSTTDQKEYALLPAINIGEVSMVQIRRCPLPLGQPIQTILDRLGIKARSLIFQTYGADLGGPLIREHLKGLNDVERLVLSGNGLTDLPEDLFLDMKNLTWLDLKSNKVHLPKDIFVNLDKLDYLELGYNNLQNLEPGVFRNQKRLKHLNLWGNNLRNLTRENFEGVVSIVDLDLSANNIQTLNPDVFQPLKNLTNLNLSANNFTTLPEGLFAENKNLLRLRFIDNRAELPTLPPGFLSELPKLEDVRIKCSLRELPENVFSGSINILNISLSSNLIESLPSHLLSDQSNLLDLDLSGNRLQELPEELFANTRSLLVLRLSRNRLVNISRDVFSHLQSIREIYLNNNLLHRIQSNAFVAAKSLQIIDLESNLLSFEDEGSGLIAVDFSLFGSPFQNLGELRYLNLKNNSITNIYRDWMFNMPKLEYLDLSYNKMSMLSHSDLQFLSQQIQVNLSHNLIEEFDFRDIELLEINPDTKKVTIFIDDNPLMCNCIILNFVKYLRSEIGLKLRNALRIRSGNLKCSSPPNLKDRPVKSLHLKELVCPLDSEKSKFKKCPLDCECNVRTYDNALIANCSNLNLTKVPHLPRLKNLGLKFIELHIENNSIMKLPKLSTNESSSLSNSSDPDSSQSPASLSGGFADVRELYASNNNISELYLSNIPEGLQIFDVTYNNLGNINATILKALNRTNNLSLALGNNPWICDCDTLPLASFVRTSFQKISDLDQMECITGEKFSEISPGDLCSKEETIIIALTIFIAVLGISAGIVVALYYKYQQEVKVWLFAHNMCLWFVTEQELDKDKKYDAFISYSHKDEDFVTEYLVPELENGPNPFKLCLHIRDWVVGEFIPNQIAKSVEDSRRTIVVLSPNFLESIWGRMEFRAAHTAALSEGRARVIVIIYGDIGETDNLDPELKAYLKMNTYVKWGDPWFWNKLRYAMPHPKQNNLHGGGIIGSGCTGGNGSRTSSTMGLVKSAIKSSTDDKLELIKPIPVTPPLTTPPAEQASKNPLISKLNGEVNHGMNGKIPNGMNGHVNGAFIINTNAKQSDV